MYKEKYLKYKTKYLTLKNSYGGTGPQQEIINRIKLLQNIEKEKENLIEFQRKIDTEMQEKIKNAIITVKSDGLQLEYLKDLQNNKEVVLFAVQSNGDALQYASINLKEDKEVVLAAVGNKASALKYANKKYKTDTDIIAEIIIKNPSEFAKVEYQTDLPKEDIKAYYLNIIQKAVSLDSKFIEKLTETATKSKSKEFKDFYANIAILVVKVDGLLLKDLSPILKKNKEIIIEAMFNNQDALEHAEPTLKQKIKKIISDNNLTLDKNNLPANHTILQYIYNKLESEQGKQYTFFKFFSR